MIEDSRELFEFMIAESESANRKCQIYTDYAEYLCKWGFIDEAIKLLLKKMKYEEGSFSKVKETARIIHDIRTNKDMYTSVAQDNFANWKRIEEDEDFEGILTDITTNIPKSS